MLGSLFEWAVDHLPGAGALETAAHAVGIHGPTVRYGLKVILAALAVAIAIFSFRGIAAGLRWWPAASPRWARLAAIVLSLGLVVGLVGPPPANPTGSPGRADATMVPGRFVPPPLVVGRVVQAATLSCVTDNQQQLHLPKRVAPADYLLLVYASAGYGARSQLVTGVSDDDKDHWVSLYDSGPRSSDGVHWVDLSVFRVVHARGGSPTITLFTRSGQSAGSVALLEVSGVTHEGGAEFAVPALSDASGFVPAPGSSIDAADPIAMFVRYPDATGSTPSVGWQMLAQSEPRWSCASAVIIVPTRPTSPAGLQTSLPSLAGFAAGVIYLNA